MPGPTDASAEVRAARRDRTAEIEAPARGFANVREVARRRVSASDEGESCASPKGKRRRVLVAWRIATTANYRAE